MTDTTIYAARTIHTMNPARPAATHVAVRDGRILGAGTLDELEGWGPYELDRRFADKILMPGFVEGHSHASEGEMWQKVYCGWFDRSDPDGKPWTGLQTLDAVLERLKRAEAALEDAETPLAGWQLDPIYFDDGALTRHDLDKVSATRPLGVLHASGHLLYANTRALERAGYLKGGMNHPGVPLGEDGLPTGVIKGPEMMMPLAPFIGFERSMLDCSAPGLRDFARLCVRSGTTTATDLGSGLAPDTLAVMQRVTGEPGFPICLVPLRFFMGLPARDLVSEAQRLAGLSTDRLRLGTIKVIADGSIQGFSARLRWPSYYNGAPNGLWYVTPEHLAEIFDHALRAGVQVHIHTNGDQATQLVLDTLAPALRKCPDADHRFTLQHCQLADAAQMRRAARLGMCVNLFANHHYYWGDEHYRLTVGPERATRMNACRTALDCGLPLAIHSDAPITPLAPLFTAWAAVTRRTASGRVQGEHERITVAEALRAITLGAAYTLRMDGEIGSIETGKRADFAVLDADPLTVAPDEIKDIPVWGTVQGGRVFAASEL